MKRKDVENALKTVRYIPMYSRESLERLILALNTLLYIQKRWGSDSIFLSSKGYSDFLYFKIDFKSKKVEVYLNPDKLTDADTEKASNMRLKILDSFCELAFSKTKLYVNRVLLHSQVWKEKEENQHM